MKRPEYSFGALVMALVALGLIAVAFSATWFEYDFSSGRQTAPGGPYPDEVDGVERHHLEYTAGGWEGDIEPSDPALAQDAVDLMTYGIYAAAGALALVVLAEIPGFAHILRRRVSLAFIFIALVAVTAVAALAWDWLPESMAGHGVDSQYTARLDEPVGYTHTTMSWGWYAAALSTAAVFATGLFKFQAGHADPNMVEEHVTQAQDT